MTKSYTILVAEDDRDIAELVTLHLEMAGYAVVSASDGEEAYDLFKSHDIDLALIDIMMPKLNGYDLTKLIRQESTIPIMIL